MQKCLKCDQTDGTIIYTHDKVVSRCNFCGRVYETSEQKVINRNFQKLARQKERDRVIFSFAMILIIMVDITMGIF